MTVFTSSTHLPQSLRVGPFDISITVESVHWSNSQGAFGQFSACEQAIKLQPEFPTMAKLTDTVLHEILHAIYWTYGVEDEDKEERTVSTLATGLTQVLRDNPSLRKWLAIATE